MIPIVTPQQMAAVDAAAPEPTQVLIERAGAAVARTAVEMMGGRYGRRVEVLAGKGNNGADGRAAARCLRSVGVRVRITDISTKPSVVAHADLYIDAALGTGLTRPWVAPVRANPDAPVLAVDIPSGLSGLNGDTMGGTVWPADRTVTFAALKPGLLLGAGLELCGKVTVADIGLSVGSTFRDAPRCDLITDDDIVALPAGSGTTHKWHAGVLVVAGSVGMEGAAVLTCAAALRSGARIVHLSAPFEVDAPVEVVRSVPPLNVSANASSSRFRACAVGPGIGLSRDSVVRLCDALSLNLPTVVDADALRLLRRASLEGILHRRHELSVPTVLTPHMGELRSLIEDAQPADPIGAARHVAREFRAVTLLKGGPTVIANPDGRVVICTSGDARLATAGSGDVLTGMIAGRLAALEPDALLRTAEAAHIHGCAGSAVRGARFVAGDLIKALSIVTR